MKKHLTLMMGLFMITLFASGNLSAEVNFEKDIAHYQKLCESEKSYRANKSTCIEYEKYLSKKANNSKNIEKSLKQAVEDTKSDISKLSEVIKQANLLIKEKETLISNTEKEIKVTKKEIKELEDELLERLELAQEMSNENFVIDFIMASESLEDFLLKLDGVNAMNTANSDLVETLAFKQKKLVEKEGLLKEETAKLKETEALNKKVLKEYHQKEAELFAQLEAEMKAQATYNSALDNLNYEDFDSLNNEVVEKDNGSAGDTNKKPTKDKNNNNNNNSNNNNNNNNNNNSNDKDKEKEPAKPKPNTKLRIPTNRGYISAVAWYYPASFGGGWHPGIDIAAASGTPIYAPGKGVELMRASTSTGYGNYVVTAHQVGNDTYTFLLGHMSRFGSSTSTLATNQVIGYVGRTGFSTGPHVHVEIFKHKNKSLSKVVNTYKNNRDIYFGLGYNSTGNCSNVCRLAPQSYYGLSYGQSF